MEAPVNTKSLSSRFTLDYRVIAVLLIVIILGMLAIWRPWENPQAKERTIEVTGQATVTAVPDEFIFSPSYEFTNSDKQAALTALTKKSSDLIIALKALGINDKDIKTNSDGYDYPIFQTNDSTPTYTLRLTITAHTKELAQKIQDYLITTSPNGAVSPQANFSTSKRVQLEASARDLATKDARSKAEQSAKNLGFSLGSVKTVTDATGFGGVYPLAAGVPQSTVSAPELSIQPGENDLTYNVTVTYFVQ